MRQLMPIKKYLLFLSLVSILIFWSIYSYFNQGIIYSLTSGNPQKVINFIGSFGWLAGVIFVLLVILEVTLAPIPPLVLYIAGGFLFGAFVGGVLTLFGNLVGAGIDFQIARTFGRKFIKRKIGSKRIKRFDDFSKKHGNISIFLLRLNPFTSSDLFSYLAGLTKMKMKGFLIATGLGLVPLVFVQTYFGGVIMRKNSVFSLILIIVSILYLLVFVYLILKSLKKRN